jgi:hypothetical protein
MAVAPFAASMPVPEHGWAPPERGWMSPLGQTIRDLAAGVLGTSSADRDWHGRLRSLLDPLRAAFAEHRAETEGDAGLYADLVSDAPRLANTVYVLVAEHDGLDTAMARLASSAEARDADPQVLRRHTLDVLVELTRHRQHDSDLVYEAYTTDIGGE